MTNVRMKVMERLKEIPRLPTRPEALLKCEGMYFNEAQWRLEQRFMGIQKPMSWVAVEGLIDLDALPDDDLKRVIVGTPMPLQEMLADFYFSGWRFNRYERQAWALS